MNETWKYICYVHDNYGYRVGRGCRVLIRRYITYGELTSEAEDLMVPARELVII